jgi:sodium transport system permease protein
MRWSIIRLIFCRELRDQLRDRRTVFMIAVLPIVLYPILGMAVVQFSMGRITKPSVIGIVGSEHLPPLRATSARYSPLPATAWFSLTPSPLSGGIDRIAGSAGLSLAAQTQLDYPPLLLPGPRLADSCFDLPAEAQLVRVELLAGKDASLLEEKGIDLLVTVPADFSVRLEAGNRPDLELSHHKGGDERSRQAASRLYGVLARWKQQLRDTRLQRRGLPTAFNDPLGIRDPDKDKATDELAAEGLLELLVRIFPFLLVMWSLAGALYPAVDLCAGEKERGTMETLLISPASREEIVLGKFLTIWVFSAVTALLNLGSMGITTAQYSAMLTQDVLRPAAIFWCILLALPLSAFFSAISLAVGAYARSTKEGQYYLMPLFLVTMPLVFLTLAPGVELSPFYSLVPVTGVALLMQRLMTSPLQEIPWLYFLPVLAPTALYSWFALRWAIAQFKREEVLFREAERLDLRLWMQRLFRDKEPLPSLGQALFCFGLILALRWFSFGIGGRFPLVVTTGVIYLAFVTAPPLLMALQLTTRPLQGLGLCRPSLRAVLVAALLALLLLPPLAELTQYVLRQFPGLTQLLRDRQPLVEALRTPDNASGDWWQFLLVFVLMPAICEELAFRGFILKGLQARLAPWPAILVSSVLFALYHMNVFQVVPAFVLGVVLGLLAVKSGSVVPSVLFHLLHNGMLIGVAILPQLGYAGENVPLQELFHPAVTIVFSLAAIAILRLLSRGLRSPLPASA